MAQPWKVKILTCDVCRHLWFPANGDTYRSEFAEKTTYHILKRFHDGRQPGGKFDFTNI
jgi:hypothetical protein